MTKLKEIDEIAQAYVSQLLETTRRTIALRKLHPGCFVRYRRAAKDGPNSKHFLVFVAKAPDLPRCYILDAATLDAMASEVTSAETCAFYASQPVDSES